LMSSLTDLPEVVGFFSYSREDDADSLGALSALRSRIQGELRGQIGRTAKTFRLWQDREAIPSGTLWETEIKNAVAQSVFFIPIITPTVVASPYCRLEIDTFLAREAALGRNDLVFPILYIHVPALEDSVRRSNDPVLALIAKRQYFDWREFRHLDSNATEAKRAVERFCGHIRDALQRSWISPEERAAEENTAALRRAEDDGKREEAEVRRQQEARTSAAVEQPRESAEQERWHQTEAERHRVEVERPQAGAQRRRDEAEAKRGDEEEPRRAKKEQPRGLLRSQTLRVGLLAGLAVVVLIGVWLAVPQAPAPVAPTPSLAVCNDELCGTTWNYTQSGDDDPAYKSCPIVFKPNNEMIYCNINPGPYSVQGNVIRFSINDDYAEFQGTIIGTRMSGTAKNVKNESWTWRATKN
jgi:hypothetical protein